MQVSEANKMQRLRTASQHKLKIKYLNNFETVEKSTLTIKCNAR